MYDVTLIGAQVLGRIHEIDVSEDVDAIYVQRGTVIERVEEPHHRPWYTETDWSEEIRIWQDYIRAGGSAFAAFDGERVLGFSVLRTALDEETAQLAGLYVDRRFRRQGLGRTLVSHVVESARSSGASRLYVSSSRYESAVDFYLDLGFQPLQTPDQRLFEIEPCDIHMSMSI